MWLRWLERYIRDVEVVGSNPVIPTLCNVSFHEQKEQIMNREDILKTEYSKKFDELMSSEIQGEIDPHFNELRKNMMVVSFYKYGPVRDNYEKHKCMDTIGNMKKRLQKYKETGNTEFLADVANFAMIEYMYPAKKVVSSSKKKAWQPPTLDDFSMDRMFETSTNIILDTYTKTGDTSLLVTIAALAGTEFTHPTLENAYYKPTDSGACETVGFGIKQMQDEMEEEESRAYRHFM